MTDLAQSDIGVRTQYSDNHPKKSRSGGALLFVDEVGVDLGGGDVLVGEHLADGVDVHSSGDEQGGVGVVEAVEGDVFGDAGLLEPRLQAEVDHIAVETFEYEAGAGRAADGEGFAADGDGGFCVGLFGADADAFAAVREVLDVLPAEGEDVADSKPG